MQYTHILECAQDCYLSYIVSADVFSGVGLSHWKRTGRRYTMFLSTSGVGICGFIIVAMMSYGKF